MTTHLESIARFRELQKAAQARADDWQRLVDEYLPIRDDKEQNWRYSRGMRADEPAQGWKLHVSATLLNAPDVFRACAPYLREHDVMFKACSSIDRLTKLNSGMFYGFSQVGKCMTIYPKTTALALQLADELDRRTAQFQAPRVPYDLQYRPGSCVHYRYGAFRTIEVVDPKGRRGTAIRDPKGKLWADRREPGHAVPAWLMNPFQAFEEPPAVPLCTEFLIYDALMQRGKGGVYEAVDIRTIPARKAVVKEGRRHGETSMDGLDGRDRVLHEEHVLRALAAAGLPVPEVLATFGVDEHRYLAIEYLDGPNLMELCSRPRRKLPVATADAFAARIAYVVAQIHAAGWVWRDLKPLNLIVTGNGTMRPIDFEGSVRIDEPCAIPWGTEGYTPPELRRGPVTGSNLPEDLYGLGATLHHLYTSFLGVKQESGGGPKAIARPPVGDLRKGVHSRTRALIAALLDPDPMARPRADEVAAELARRDTDAELVWHRPRRRRIKGFDENAPVQLAEAIPGAEKVVLYQPRPFDEHVA
jgi:tRNA A-37 threonylcarbamoyl transferase component Bud32